MGSFNMACSLSGLHISPGDDVYCMLIADSQSLGDLRRDFDAGYELYDQWVPITPYVKATYNDYGGCTVMDAENSQLEVWRQILGTLNVSLEDGITLDKNLYLPLVNKYGVESGVRMAYIHGAIFDALLEEIAVEDDENRKSKWDSAQKEISESIKGRLLTIIEVRKKLREAMKESPNGDLAIILQIELNTVDNRETSFSQYDCVNSCLESVVEIISAGSSTKSLDEALTRSSTLSRLRYIAGSSSLHWRMKPTYYAGQEGNNILARRVLRKALDATEVTDKNREW